MLHFFGSKKSATKNPTDPKRSKLLKPRIFLLKHLRLDKLSSIFPRSQAIGKSLENQQGFSLWMPYLSQTFLSELSNSHGWNKFCFCLSSFAASDFIKKLKQLMSLQRPCSKVIERCSHPSFNTLEVIIAIEGMGSLLMNHRNMWRLQLIATQVAIGLVRLAHQHNGPSMEILCDETFQKVLASVPARAIRCEDAKCPEIQVMTLNDIP